jgi:hypothetical protein
LTENETQKTETIGLNVRDTKKRLDKLTADRRKIWEERTHFLPNQYGDTPMKYIELSQKLNAIDNEIAQVREWYNIGLSESLYHESKRLNNLTTWLIILTAFLGGLTIVDILSRVIKRFNHPICTT